MITRTAFWLAAAGAFGCTKIGLYSEPFAPDECFRHCEILRGCGAAFDGCEPLCSSALQGDCDADLGCEPCGATDVSACMQALLDHDDLAADGCTFEFEKAWCDTYYGKDADGACEGFAIAGLRCSERAQPPPACQQTCDDAISLPPDGTFEALGHSAPYLCPPDCDDGDCASCRKGAVPLDMLFELTATASGFAFITADTRTWNAELCVADSCSGGVVGESDESPVCDKNRQEGSGYAAADRAVCVAKGETLRVGVSQAELDDPDVPEPAETLRLSTGFFPCECSARHAELVSLGDGLSGITSSVDGFEPCDDRADTPDRPNNDEEFLFMVDSPGVATVTATVSDGFVASNLVLLVREACPPAEEIECRMSSELHACVDPDKLYSLVVDGLTPSFDVDLRTKFEPCSGTRTCQQGSCLEAGE